MSTPFAHLTTLQVGGSPRVLLTANTRDELVTHALTAFDDENWLILGGGSNLLVADKGFDGTVVHVHTRGVESHFDGDRVLVTVEAGEPWDDFVAYTVEQGWTGLESLSGIPGSVGASPVQNIGAYGHEVGEFIERVLFLDEAERQPRWLVREALALGYRSSVFKPAPGSVEAPLRGVILAVEFALHLSGGQSALIAYPQLAEELSVQTGQTAPLTAVREAVLSLRAAKGMVLNASDPDTRSAGSFFTNPIVSERFAYSLPSDAPRWLVEESSVLEGEAVGALVKLSAAWLIEHAGIHRGFSLPGSRAAVSSKHTLAITNRGGATAADIAELARFVQGRVLSEFGVHLQPEPLLVGVEL